MMIQKIINAIKKARTRKKNYKKLSNDYIDELQDRGFDVHGEKSSQGNLGDINYYSDQKGDLYYSIDGRHFEPVYRNVNDPTFKY